MSALEAIRWQLGPPASLQLLDQRLLPLESVYIDIDGPEAAFAAIKVRPRRHGSFCSYIHRLGKDQQCAL
jgi:methylthioribose-1-phosphate isomerase